MKKILLIAMNVTILCACTVHARSGGTTQADVLKLNTSAKVAAMAGTFVGIADTVDALYFNPAGLAQLTTREASLSHFDYAAGIYYEQAAYAQKIGRGVIAGGINFLYTEDEYRDSNGDKGSRFLNYNGIVNIGYAQALVAEQLFIGATVKGISQKYDTEEAHGVCADIGGLYRVNKRIALGVSVQNMGPTVKFAHDEGEMPLTLRAGVGVHPIERWVIGLDALLPYKGEHSFSFGTEYKVLDCLPLRAGYRFREYGNDLGAFDGISVGLGFTIKEYTLDYAFTPMGEYTSSHRISLSIRW